MTGPDAPVMVCTTCARPKDGCVCAGTYAAPRAETVPVPGGTRAALARLAALTGPQSVPGSQDAGPAPDASHTTSQAPATGVPGDG